MFEEFDTLSQLIILLFLKLTINKLSNLKFNNNEHKEEMLKL